MIQIYNYFLQSYLKYLFGKDTANGYWSSLEKSFVDSLPTNLMQLRWQIQSMRTDNMSMNEYISKTKDLFNTLIALGDNITIHDKIFYLFDGLNFDYNSLMTKLTYMKNVSSRRGFSL